MPWLLSSLYVSDVILRRREIPRGWEIPSHPSSNPTLPIGIASIVAEFQIDVNKIDQEGLDFSDDVCYSKFLEQQNRKMEGELMHKQIQATIRSLTILVTVSTLAGCVFLFGGSQLVDEEQVAVIATEKGKIVIELYPDSAPATVENFQKLIRKKFYDWLTFHRKEVTVDLNIIQGGDPEGNGRGGPGYTIIDEYTNPNQRPHLRGTVAMARTKIPNSGGSQFYICLKPQPNLDGRYTTFGRVIQGIDVVDQLVKGDIMKKVRLEAKSKYVTSNK